MSNPKSLRILDRKGIVVGTWVRGEVFNLRAGDRITFNPSGVPMYRGKILNLSADVQNRLVVARRVSVEG